MSARSRRRHRRTSRKRNPFLLALVLMGATAMLVALGGGLYVLSVAAEAPAIDELTTNIAKGGNSVDLRRRRHPAGLHPVRRGADPVKYDYIPDACRDGTVAIEDERFWDHHGVDVEGVIRAGVREPPGRRGQAGRLDDHQAAGAQPLHPGSQAGPRAQDQRGEDRDRARGRATRRSGSSTST